MDSGFPLCRVLCSSGLPTCGITIYPDVVQKYKPSSSLANSHNSLRALLFQLFTRVAGSKLSNNCIISLSVIKISCRGGRWLSLSNYRIYFFNWLADWQVEFLIGKNNALDFSFSNFHYYSSRIKYKLF